MLQTVQEVNLHRRSNYLPCRITSISLFRFVRASASTFVAIPAYRDLMKSLLKGSLRMVSIASPMIMENHLIDSSDLFDF